MQPKTRWRTGQDKERGRGSEIFGGAKREGMVMNCVTSKKNWLYIGSDLFLLNDCSDSFKTNTRL